MFDLITELAPPPWDAAQKAGGSAAEAEAAAKEPPTERTERLTFPPPACKGEGSEGGPPRPPVFGCKLCRLRGSLGRLFTAPLFFFGVPAMAASEIRRRLSKARPRAKTWGASRWTAARWERRLLIAAAAARGRDDYYMASSKVL